MKKLILTIFAVMLWAGAAGSGIVSQDGILRIGGSTDGIQFFSTKRPANGATYWLTARTAYWDTARTDLWNTARNTETP